MRSIATLLLLGGLLQGVAAPIKESAEVLAKPDFSASELNAQGVKSFNLSNYRDAERLYREALALWDKAGPAAALDRVATAGNLGVVLRAEGRYAEAETLLLDCLRQAESLTGPNSGETGHATSSLAALYLVWDQFPKAESYAVRADAIFSALSEARARDQVNNWRILSSVYLELGRYEEAKARLKEILSDPGEPLAPGAYNELAVIALRQNQPEEAESLARRALESADQRLPAAHPDRGAILNSLAQACRLQKRYEEAEKHYREAISAWTASVGPGHPYTAKGYVNLAAFYHERGREAGAEQLYRRAAEILEAAYGANHPTTVAARRQLAEVLRTEGRSTEADRINRSILGGTSNSLVQP